jgi:uncharacterized protein (DUF2336 family)
MTASQTNDRMLQSLITELNRTLTTASEAQQLSILRRVTDLFLERASDFSAEHIAVFDDVIGLLIKRADKAALIELSRKIAPVQNAPAKLVDTLACHDNIAIAGPILEKSNSISEKSLAGVAAAAGEKHLQALAARAHISEAVTDILIDRAGADVVRKLVTNPGARLSEIGFVKLINRSKADGALASMIAERPDLPPELEPFLKLALVSDEA